jgi:PAS domain S-box-containing protein
MWATLSSGREWRGEFCNRKKNGELYWELASISPIQDAEGNITHYVAVKEDITERKRTESLLQESETRYRLFVENASDLIYRTDVNGLITYANQPVLHVLGYASEEEVLGKHYLELTSPELRHKVQRAYMRQYIRRTKNTYHEFPTLSADGREVWLGQNVQLIMESDKVLGFQAIARDITAIKQAQEALRIAYDQALEASRAKSQLLAKVSHELRTPLGGILGYAELLQDGTFGPLQETQKKAADEILQSAHYLALMVNELLDEAQIQAHTATLQEDWFSPATLLEQAISGMGMLAQKKGLEFTTSIDSRLPRELYGDDRRLRQILINLIGNAIKFTKEGRVGVRLQCPDSGHWVIQVTDTGIGIPEEAHSSIFEPFKQANNAITRENRGIGLGLSITKQLVELMGGRILVESQVGAGSTFTVLLPIVKQPVFVE